MIYAGVLAGGVGSRMGETSLPKQFLSIAGKPIIIHSIEKFLLNPRFDRIFVAVVPDYAGHTRELIAKHIGNEPKITVLSGGADRNESIVNVISEIRKTDSNKDSILITHDAVRPFVSANIIEENIGAAIEFGAVDTAAPAFDTIIRSQDGEFIEEIPVRSELFHGQTPQSFRIDWFEQDYNSLTATEKAQLTDACKIFTLKGRKVKIVTGDSRNIKITTQFDLKIAQALISI